MRFMSFVTSAHTEMPTPELMEAMGKLADREIKAGRMIDMGGLMPLETGAQVRIKDGELSVIDGPFVEAKEVIGGYAIFEFRNKEEALGLGGRVHAAAQAAHAGLGRHLRGSRDGRAGRYGLPGRTGRRARQRLMRGTGKSSRRP